MTPSLADNKGEDSSITCFYGRHFSISQLWDCGACLLSITVLPALPPTEGSYQLRILMGGFLHRKVLPKNREPD